VVMTKQELRDKLKIRKKGRLVKEEKKYLSSVSKGHKTSAAREGPKNSEGGFRSKKLLLEGVRVHS